MGLGASTQQAGAGTTSVNAPHRVPGALTWRRGRVLVEPEEVMGALMWHVAGEGTQHDGRGTGGGGFRNRSEQRQKQQKQTKKLT